MWLFKVHLFILEMNFKVCVGLHTHTHTCAIIVFEKLSAWVTWSIFLHTCQTSPMFTMILHLLKEGKENVNTWFVSVSCFYLRQTNVPTASFANQTRKTHWLDQPLQKQIKELYACYGGCLSYRQRCSCHWQLLTCYIGYRPCLAWPHKYVIILMSIGFFSALVVICSFHI